MTTRPTANELVDAVREHLATRVLPMITDPQLKFQTLVAAHVLGVVSREMTGGEAREMDTWRRLRALLGSDVETTPRGDELTTQIAVLEAQLCAAIRAGAFDSADRRDALMVELTASTEAALGVWNPAFLARVRGVRLPPTSR